MDGSAPVVDVSSTLGTEELVAELMLYGEVVGSGRSSPKSTVPEEERTKDCMRGRPG
jgi:hypothetical protein